VVTAGECLRGEGEGDRRPCVVDWSGGMFASCITRVIIVRTLYGWPQFAL